MTYKIRTTTFSVIIAFVLLLASFSPASAAPHLNVHIEVDEIIGESGELFLASGPAVDAGVVCGYGKVYELGTTVSGPPSGAFSILTIEKLFQCGDNSGTFTLKLKVRLDHTTGETSGRWKVTGGTDAYASLDGQGVIEGTPIVVGTSIHDVYDGRVR